MNEQRQRLLSGFFLVLIVIFIIKFGGLFLFRLALSAVILLTLNEFFKIFKVDGFFRNIGYAFGFIFPFLVKIYPPYAVLVIFLLLMFSLTVLVKEITGETLNALFAFFFGIFYIPFLLSFLISLRVYSGDNNTSENLVLFLLFVLWVGDTFSMYIGKRFGKTKLAPTLSPNKTVAGTVGGLFFNVLIALICKAIFLDIITGLEAILFGLVIGLTAQVGDLCESYIKRCFDLKDTGEIIPGHGGMLDRIDSLIFAAPIFYYLLKLFGM
ncbi:phosphatidate cytidylyltransferase [bacterium]|nr:phosphatidate cytidylyltransferase [bacterium]